MILVALAESADRGELLLVNGGLCRYRCRADGVVTIRELLVLPHLRLQGIGRRLVEEVASRHPTATLRARCPTGSRANGFWRRLGFGLACSEASLNCWERDP